MPATLVPSATDLSIEEPITHSLSPAAAVYHPAHHDRLLLVLAFAALLSVGVFLRFFPSSGFPVTGYDEHLYSQYLHQLDLVGPWNYPDLVEAYLDRQAKVEMAMLPPTRVGFLLPAWAWHRLTGVPELVAVRTLAALASCMALAVTAGFAGRLGGRGRALAALALMACAPLQIHLAQRALIDGYFAFWTVLALWTLWECLQRPETGREVTSPWLWAYGGSLAAMVLTKENAAFVFAAFVGLLALAPWVRFGPGQQRPGRTLWVMTFAAPAVGFAVLILLCGGMLPLVNALRLNVQKSVVLLYAIRTGNGPWQRYLLDLLTLSPAVVLLAVGGVFGARRGGRDGAFLLAGFVVLTYAMMCQLRHGMNLRYGAIWDLPIRLLALGQLAALCERFKARRDLVFALGVLVLAGLDLRSYYQMFVVGAVYDPVPADMLRVLEILKR